MCWKPARIHNFGWNPLDLFFLWELALLWPKRVPLIKAYRKAVYRICINHANIYGHPPCTHSCFLCERGRGLLH